MSVDSTRSTAYRATWMVGRSATPAPGRFMSSIRPSRRATNAPPGRTSARDGSNPGGVPMRPNTRYGPISSTRSYQVAWIVMSASGVATTSTSSGGIRTSPRCSGFEPSSGYQRARSIGTGERRSGDATRPGRGVNPATTPVGVKISTCGIALPGSCSPAASRGLSALARTAAPEEALDAVLDAFAASEPGAHAGRPAGALLLPWANMRRPTGERQQHGITGSMIADEVVAAPPPTRVVNVAPGVAGGASLDVKGTGTVRRTQRPKAAPARRTPAPAAPRASRASTSSRKREVVALSAEAIDRMKTELDQLTRVRRPDVVARIKAARELGDLKENSDYQAAREEQSFLEGRVRLLEDRLPFAGGIHSTPHASMVGRVVLGSVVTVELDGEPVTFTLVGTTDAKPAAGRISTSSPVGAALLGAAAGDEVERRPPP